MAPKHARRGGARRPPPAWSTARPKATAAARAHAQPQRQRRLAVSYTVPRSRPASTATARGPPTRATPSSSTRHGDRCARLRVRCRTRCSRGAAFHPSSASARRRSSPARRGCCRSSRDAVAGRQPAGTGERPRRGAAPARRRASSAPASTRRSGCGGAVGERALEPPHPALIDSAAAAAHALMFTSTCPASRRPADALPLQLPRGGRAAPPHHGRRPGRGQCSRASIGSPAAALARPASHADRPGESGRAARADGGDRHSRPPRRGVDHAGDFRSGGPPGRGVPVRGGASGGTRRKS